MENPVFVNVPWADIVGKPPETEASIAFAKRLLNAIEESSVLSTQHTLDDVKKTVNGIFLGTDDR